MFDLDPCSPADRRPWDTAINHIGLPQDGLNSKLERTHAGLASARAQGRIGGCKPSMDKSKIKKTIELHDKGVKSTGHSKDNEMLKVHSVQIPCRS